MRISDFKKQYGNNIQNITESLPDNIDLFKIPDKFITNNGDGTATINIPDPNIINIKDVANTVHGELKELVVPTNSLTNNGNGTFTLNVSTSAGSGDIYYLNSDIIQKTFLNTKRYDVFNIDHKEDVDNKRIVNVSKKVDGISLIDSSIDFDLEDESAFIQEDATNGTDFSYGNVKLQNCAGVVLKTELTQGDNSFSNYSQHYGDYNLLFDNNKTTRWDVGSVPLTFPLWFEYDLKGKFGKAIKITDIGIEPTVASSGYYPTWFEIHVSYDDRNTWETIKTVSNITWDDDLGEIIFSLDGEYIVDAIRVVFPDKTCSNIVNDGRLIIYEATIYGYNGVVSYPTDKGYYVTTSDTNHLNLKYTESIQGLIIDRTVPTGTDIKMFISTDGRNTWKTWNGTNWTPSATTLDNIATIGNSVAEVCNNITSLDITNVDYLDFAFYLVSTVETETPSINQITLNYTEKASYVNLNTSDYEVKYLSPTRTVIKQLIDQPYESLKVNVMLPSIIESVPSTGESTGTIFNKSIIVPNFLPDTTRSIIHDPDTNGNRLIQILKKQAGPTLTNNTLAFESNNKANYNYDDTVLEFINGSVQLIDDGTLSGEINLRSLPFTQISYGQHDIATGIFDGISDTSSSNFYNEPSMWTQTQGVVEPWVGMELTEKISLTKYIIYYPWNLGSTYGPKAWKIQGRNDNNVWEDIDIQENIVPANGKVVEITLITPSDPYNAFRIYFTAVVANGNWQNSLNEVEFFGTNSSYITNTIGNIKTDINTSIDISSWEAILSCNIIYNQPTGTTIEGLISFDGRQSWKYWNGTSWEDFTGTKNTIEEIITGFNNLTINKSTMSNIDFDFDLLTTDELFTPRIDDVVFNYTEYSTYSSTTDYAYEVHPTDNKITKIHRLTTSGDPENIKVNVLLGSSSTSSGNIVNTSVKNKIIYTNGNETISLPGINSIVEIMKQTEGITNGLNLNTQADYIVESGNALFTDGKLSIQPLNSNNIKNKGIIPSKDSKVDNQITSGALHQWDGVIKAGKYDIISSTISNTFISGSSTELNIVFDMGPDLATISGFYIKVKTYQFDKRPKTFNIYTVDDYDFSTNKIFKETITVVDDYVVNEFKYIPLSQEIETRYLLVNINEKFTEYTVDYQYAFCSFLLEGILPNNVNYVPKDKVTNTTNGYVTSTTTVGTGNMAFDGIFKLNDELVLDSTTTTNEIFLYFPIDTYINEIRMYFANATSFNSSFNIYGKASDGIEELLYSTTGNTPNEPFDPYSAIVINIEGNKKFNYIKYENNTSGSVSLAQIEMFYNNYNEYEIGSSVVVSTTDNTALKPTELNFSGINKINVGAVRYPDTNIRFLLSFDNKASWKTWDSNTNEFVTETLDNILTNGIDFTTINNLTGINVNPTDIVHIAIGLETNTTSNAPIISSIAFDLASAFFKKIIDTDITINYDYVNKSIELTNNTGNKTTYLLSYV
jgi:hypothetical protein